MDYQHVPLLTVNGVMILCLKGIIMILLLNASGLHAIGRGKHSGVCESMDIRNNISAFHQLDNCTVIEGTLSILLMDRVSRVELEKLSFPNLVEITDYLLLFRVQNLRTLRHLFPNLSVIRGQNLLYTYSLVAFEMPHLEEIGLVNLTVMERGAVRLEKNPSLCFTQTVDWARIARSSKPDDHYIRENKNPRDCLQFCPDYCTEVERSKDDKTKVKRCWAVNDCQKICPSACPGNCDSNGRCCNKHCLGGCNGPTIRDCIACSDVVYEGVCQSRCQPGTYLFKERRCLTKQQCKESCFKVVDGLDGPHRSKCTQSCPKGYTEEVTEERDGESASYTKRCVKCAKGKCPKECSTAYIDSVSSAQKFKDCTIIKGSLEIHLLGGTNIGQELVDSLGQIEEVRDYVRITKSYPLLSLHFFKSLRVIGGEKLDNNEYALFVLDNRNLEELFRPEIQAKLSIKKGLVFFHFNRKLCFNKIEAFVHEIEPRSQLRMSDLNVSVSTENNGDRATCSFLKLDLKVHVKQAEYVIIRWKNFVTGDQRQLLRYVISYRESNGQKMDIYQGRDACTDIWNTEYKNPESKNNTFLYYFIQNLKPYTSYSVYVETYMISGANTGAMSDIEEFRTKPKDPDKPELIRTHAETHSTLTLRWDPPKNPNGNVTHYKIYWRPRERPSMEGLDKKDFCKEPWKLPEDTTDEEEEAKKEEEKKLSSVDGQPCCACPKTKKAKEREEQDRQFQIQFENTIHDTVFKKWEPQEVEKSCWSRDSREKRSIHSYLKPTESPLRALYRKDKSIETTTLVTPPTNNSLDNSTNATFADLMAEVFATEFVITNLKHFTEYSIEIMACQEIDPATNIGTCGKRAFSSARTSYLRSADDIPFDSIESSVVMNKTVHNIKIMWSPPYEPNGFVITYELEYRRAKDDLLPNTACIRQQIYTKNGGYDLPLLDPGNYSYRVRASSLAGPGDWSEAKYFVVPEEKGATQSPMVVIVICVVIVIIIVFTVIIILRCFFRNKFHGPHVVSENPDYFGMEYIPDEWEIKRDKIKLIQELGQGSFGMVYEGEYTIENSTSPKMVAIKTQNDNATMLDKREFLKEASNMKRFECHHVVRLIGVVSVAPTFVVMELMGNGDLKNFLRRHRPDEEENCGRQLSVNSILQMAGEIADGMAYLGFNKFVHRDLAARNCMVADNTTVKIGDFGMTRDIYETDYYTKQGKGLLPVRWMPPESLKDGKYSYESDVWSYGVVLWEMATLAAQPYQGLANEQVLRYVIDGKTMEMPESCPDKLFKIMRACWKFKARDRPTFLEIIETLIPDLDPSFKDVSYFFSQENNPDHREMCAEGFEDPLLDGDIDTAHIPLTNSYGDFGPYQYEMRERRPANDVTPHSSNSRHTAEVEVEAGAFGTDTDRRRVSITSNPTSAISSNGDSKGSSKSSTGSYAHRNGVANGHGPFPQSTLC